MACRAGRGGVGDAAPPGRVALARLPRTRCRDLRSAARAGKPACRGIREAHADWVRGAARLGIPVLCQKPLAPTLAEATGLCQEVAGRVRLMVHENWRHRPYYRRIGQWLRAQRVGRIVQAQMRLLSSGLLQDSSGAYPILQRQPFIADLQRALVMEVLIHHIDTLRFLFGELRLLHARLGRRCPAMRGEDRAFVLFETAEAAPVALFANLATAGEPPTLTDRLLVIGEDGVIRLDGDSLQRRGKDDESHTYDLDASYRASYRDTIGHFLDALESGMEFETGPGDNLKTLALVEDIYSRS